MNGPPYHSPDITAGPVTFVIRWPVAVAVSVLAICLTSLAITGIIPRELVTHGLVLLFGIAVPTQPMVTKFKTFYSVRPPPMRIDSDRPPEG